jgi:hypothetical protein
VRENHSKGELDMPMKKAQAGANRGAAAAGGSGIVLGGLISKPRVNQALQLEAFSAQFSQ